MEFTIAAMEEMHRERVLDMMRTFYASAAVLTNGSEEIFTADIDACISDNPYLEGFVFCRGEELLGYGMAAKSFSTEFGKPCIWIEDLYVTSAHRGKGIGRRVAQALIARGQSLGFSKISAGDIYDWNEPSRALFTSLGFVPREKTKHGYRYELNLTSREVAHHAD